MPNIQFQSTQCHDDRPAICQEEAIKRVLGFAGIHDTETEDSVEDNFSAGVSAAEPDTISNLVVWLKADAITGLNDGDALTTWSDSSGNGNDFTQATAANKPTYETNELNTEPVVRFDGSDWIDASADCNLGKEHTLIVVAKLTSLVDAMIFSSESVDLQYSHFFLSASEDTVYYRVGGTAVSVAHSWIATAWGECEIMRNALDVTLRLDGALGNSTTLSADNDLLLGKIGAFHDNTHCFTGDVAEVLWYDKELSYQERGQINAYLVAKYGLLLLVSLDTDWADREGDWGVEDGVLRGTGGGAAQWYKVHHTTEVEPGLVATFDKTGDRGAFLFLCDDSYNAYMAWWTGTEVGFSSLVAGTETKLVSLPCAQTGAASVTVMAWPRSYTSIDEIDDLAMAMWFDDKLLVSHTVEYSEKGKQVGFAVYESDTITFDDLRVPQLHHLVEWTSVDPGEGASAALSRVTAYENVRVQARYDGSVKMWRNSVTDVDWTIPAGRALATDEQKSIFWPRHFRLVGALHEVATFRNGNQGHIFAVGDDPNAMTEDETGDRVDRRHKEVEEQATRMTAVLAPNPTVEAEDVVELDSVSYRVTSANYRALWQGSAAEGAPVLESSMELRECLAS